MKYTEIVKKCKIITMQHVSKNGVVYILSGDVPETYMLTIPIHKLDILQDIFVKQLMKII